MCKLCTVLVDIALRLTMVIMMMIIILFMQELIMIYQPCSCLLKLSATITSINDVRRDLANIRVVILIKTYFYRHL